MFQRVESIHATQATFFFICYNYLLKESSTFFKPLSTNPTKWSNKLNNSLAVADELFGYV